MECQKYVDMLYSRLVGCKKTPAHFLSHFNTLSTDNYDSSDMIFLHSGGYAALVAYYSAKITAMAHRSRPGKCVPEFKRMMRSLDEEPVAVRKAVAEQLRARIEPDVKERWRARLERCRRRRRTTAGTEELAGDREDPSALQRLTARLTEIDAAYTMVGTVQPSSSVADEMPFRPDVEPDALVQGSSEAVLTSRQSAAPSELVQMAAQATNLVSQEHDVSAGFTRQEFIDASVEATTELLPEFLASAISKRRVLGRLTAEIIMTFTALISGVGCMMTFVVLGDCVERLALQLFDRTLESKDGIRYLSLPGMNVRPKPEFILEGFCRDAISDIFGGRLSKAIFQTYDDTVQLGGDPKPVWFAVSDQTDKPATLTVYLQAKDGSLLRDLLYP